MKIGSLWPRGIKFFLFSDIYKDPCPCHKPGPSQVWRRNRTYLPCLQTSDRVPILNDDFDRSLQYANQYEEIMGLLLWKIRAFSSEAQHLLWVSKGHQRQGSNPNGPLSVVKWQLCNLPSLSPKGESKYLSALSSSEGILNQVSSLLGFPDGSVVKKICLLMQETRIQSLGQEDPLKEEMATHSSILAWEIPWTEEPCRLQSMGSPKSQTQLRNGVCTHVIIIINLVCRIQYSDIYQRSSSDCSFYFLIYSVPSLLASFVMA